MSHFLDPTAGWIPIGGPDHLAYLALLALAASLLIWHRSWVRQHATQVRRGVLIASVAQQLVLYGGYVLAQPDLSEALPFHISRVSSVLCVIYLLTRSKAVMDVLFYFSLWAWFSFLYPSEVWPITNIFGWSFLVSHLVTLLLPCLAWVTTDWRPSRAALWRAWGWMIVFSWVALAANALTGGNYFYQRSMPVLGFLGQPAYYLGTLLVGLAVFWIGYGVSLLVPEADEAPEHAAGVAPA